MDDGRARDLAATVERLLGELDSLPDAAARGKAIETVQALIELYGGALARVLSLADPDLRDELVRDELLSHLLIVHDLHPDPVEARVAAALDGVRPYLDSHDGGVELLGVEDGVARLRLHGSCDGCPSSAMTLKLAVEEAIGRAAPEITRVDAGGNEPAPALLQLEVAPALRPNGGGWRSLPVPPQLAPGSIAVERIAGELLLLLRVDGRLYAYRPPCPVCGDSLERAELRGAELRCPGCGSSYDARRAGRCLDSPGVQLPPVPLLEDASGEVRVALEALPA